MKKMTLRGKKFIRKSTQTISIISLLTAITIISTWALVCELKDTHSISVFRNVIIIVSCLIVIACICDYISSTLTTKIRREIKAKKAKTWWLY